MAERVNILALSLVFPEILAFIYFYVPCVSKNGHVVSLTISLKTSIIFNVTEVGSGKKMERIILKARVN